MPFIAKLHTRFHSDTLYNINTSKSTHVLMFLFSASCGASIGTSTAVGISVAMTFILSFSLGGLVTAIIICGCYNPRRFSSKTTKSPPPVPTTTAATYEVVGFNKKESNTIELESNSAYGTGRH